jgi:autotransporter translocation and assembly factor TamB
MAHSPQYRARVLIVARRSWLNRVVRWSVFAIVGLAVLIALGVALLHTSWGRARVVGLIVSQTTDYIDGELRVGRLDGSVLGQVSLHDVRVVRAGQDVLWLEQIDARYRLATFVSPNIVIDNLMVRGVRAMVVERANGWQVDGIRIPESDTPASGDGEFRITRLTLDNATVGLRPTIGGPFQLESLSGRTSLTVGDAIVLNVEQLAGVESERGLRINRFHGDVALTDAAVTVSAFEAETAASRVSGTVEWRADEHLSAQVSSPGLLLAEIAPYVPVAEPYKLTPAFTLSLDGPLAALQVAGPVSDPEAGDAVLDIVMNLSDVFAVRGNVQVTGLNVAPLMNDPEMRTHLTGRATIDLVSVERDDIPVVGTFDARLTDARYEQYRSRRILARGRITDGVVTAAAQADAYGATADGNITWTHAATRFRFTGSVRDGNPARLPEFLEVPPWSADLNGRVSLVATPTAWQVETTLTDSTVEGASIADDTVVRVAMDAGEILEYSVNGRVINVDTARMAARLPEPPAAAADMPVQVSVSLDIAGKGAMSDFMSHNVRVTATDIDATAGEASISGGSTTFTLVEHRLAGNAAGMITGQWDDVTGATDAGLKPDGKFQVTFDVPDVTAPVTSEVVSGTVSATLGESELFGWQLRSASIDARAANGLVTINALDATGPLGQLSLTGTAALGDTGDSNLKYVVDIANLEAAAGRFDLEASGSLHTEGQLTGPRRMPTLRGSLQGSTLTMSGFSALGTTGMYTATIPEFDAARLTGTADLASTFVDVGGTQFSRVTLAGPVTVSGADLTLEAEHEKGTVGFVGEIALQDDSVVDLTAREITLTFGEEQWRLVGGTMPTLRYTPSQITVDRVELAKGDQRVVVEGGVLLEDAPAGVTPPSPMVVTATGVMLGPLSRVWFGSERVTGRLDAKATVTGSLETPRAQASFDVVDGTGDDVPFKTLGGTLDVTAETARIDATLDAGARGTASIVGSVPLDASVEAIDVTVAADLVDVGVVAPALVYVADATGEAHLDLRITGSQQAPIIAGDGALTDIRFRVPETGASYQRLNSVFAVERSVLRVKSFSMEDRDGNALTITGNLDVLPGTDSGSVDLQVKATGFRLLDNQFGDLAVNLNMFVAGTLAAPQVLGSVRVERGRFEVDRLLNEFAIQRGYVPVGSPITRAAAAAAATDAETHDDAEGAAPAPSLFHGAAISVDVILPDNVIVRGRGIQTEEGTFGLGDINLTLGGSLKVEKVRGGEAGLVGDVNAVRGTYEFQGRRFAIQRGSQLRFRGTDYTNPALDIVARREISGVTVDAHITGTAAEPELRLTSQPPLDEGDILSLVVFNQPINELGTDQKVSLAARAGNLAAGAVVGPLAASVARALDLDVFDIQTTGASNTGPVVTVGRQVSDRLFVGFRHEFGANANGLTFEYRLTEYLRVVTSLSPGAQSVSPSLRAEAAGIDLIFVIRRD